MSEILVWPEQLLIPRMCTAKLVPFTRSGGRTLGGTRPAYRTDLGHWQIDLVDVEISTVAQRRTWDALDTILAGAAGRIAVPAWSVDSAPYASGVEEPGNPVPHSDGTYFTDGAGYTTSPIIVVNVGVAAIGATTIKMRIIRGQADLAGVRFSHQYALYKTGRYLEIDGDEWTVEISPPLRQQIVNGEDLEFHRPTCLCNMAVDTGMARSSDSQRFERRTVSFVEDTKYWSDLAGD
jgi:hypothetical protein